MSEWTMRIGADGPVVGELDPTGWRLIVRGRPHTTGIAHDDLHVSLRELAMRDRDLAREAFAVVMNCAGAWEDEYTEEHGEDALRFEDWMERIETGLRTSIDADGELYYSQ
jgi:hypothetical protein